MFKIILGTLQSIVGLQVFLKSFFLKNSRKQHFHRSVREAKDGIHHEGQQKQKETEKSTLHEVTKNINR